MRQRTCPSCGCVVDHEIQHRDWHVNMQARLDLLEAHSGNLIQRVYELELLNEQLLSRLVAVERATPLVRPSPPPPRKVPGWRP